MAILYQFNCFEAVSHCCWEPDQDRHPIVSVLDPPHSNQISPCDIDAFLCAAPQHQWEEAGSCSSLLGWCFCISPVSSRQVFLPPADVDNSNSGHDCWICNRCPLPALSNAALQMKSLCFIQATSEPAENRPTLPQEPSVSLFLCWHINHRLPNMQAITQQITGHNLL